ncbi:recombinase family protein [Rossellomorea vietnamensis]|nr:recombinase family protein [Rossellomorea vietnamensis]
MTVGIYIRVSTLEQAKEGYSISAQRERLTAFCTALGWNDFKYYVDEGVSAKDTNRPQLQLLMEHIKAGSISTILVYRLDRFTRKVKDLHKLLEFLETHKCAFKSATEPYDTSTAMGKLFITIVAALAEWETDNLSERIKMALEEKVSEGERVGNVPFGFDLSPEERLVKNQDSQIVLEMIDKLKSGSSAQKIAEYLNQSYNHRNWHAQGVLRVFRNPALYGATRWNDKVFEDTHEGIISKNEFIKVQTILEDRSINQKRDVKTTYLFQSLLSCHECGQALSVNRNLRNDAYLIMYKCQRCYKQGRKMKTIDEKRFIEALQHYMKDVILNELQPVPPIKKNDEREQLLKEKKHVERKREKYQRAWANDLITDEEFEKRMRETSDAHEDLQEKIKKIKAPVVVDTEAIKEIIFTFNQTFYALTRIEKKEFISRFIRRIEYRLVPQPPKYKRNKVGKDLVVITKVHFN